MGLVIELNISIPFFNEYKSKGLLDEIAENIFVLSDMNQYNEYSGLSINPTFEDAIYL